MLQVCLATDTEALSIIRQRTKVIVTSRQPMPTLKKYNLMPLHIAEPTRVRYMVINNKYVMVHLPIPFTGQFGEQSNSVHWIESPAMVAMWAAKFNAIWDLIGHQSAS